MNSAELLAMTPALSARQETIHELTLQNIRSTSIETAFERHQCAITIHWNNGDMTKGFVYQKPPRPDQDLQKEPWYFACEDGSNPEPMTYWNDEQQEQILLPRFQDTQFKKLRDAEAVRMGTKIHVESATVEDPQQGLKQEIDKGLTRNIRRKLEQGLSELSKFSSLHEMLGFANPYQVLVIRNARMEQLRRIRRSKSVFELAETCPKTIRTATMGAFLMARVQQEKALKKGNTTEPPSLEAIAKTGSQCFELLRRLRDYLNQDHPSQIISTRMGEDSAYFEELIRDNHHLAEITFAMMEISEVDQKSNLDRLLEINEDQHQSEREDTQLEAFILMLESNREDLEAVGITMSEIRTLPISRIIEILGEKPTKHPEPYPHLRVGNQKVA